jgi:catechol 2,3-dioxygenase-like lactoylglutathione lyase family enzyme
MRAGSSVLLLFNPEDSKLKISPPAHYGGGHQHFAFEVKDEDYGKTKAELTTKGIEVIDEVTWKTGKRSFYFRDPEGNVLEIVPHSGIWD